MINKIEFSNYKLFKKRQTLELKPITILIGKNSSGKSAVIRLPTLIENSLSGNFSVPLEMNNKGIELGGEFRDLVYGRRFGGVLDLSLETKDKKVRISIGSEGKNNIPTIFAWALDDVEIDLAVEKFSGFIPTSKKNELKDFILKTNYISSNREGLRRSYEISEVSRKDHDYVGINGEHVYTILIDDALTTPQNLIKEVSKIFQENFEGWGICVNTDTTPFYQVELVKDSLKINLKEVGLGMIHILPLVVSAIMPTNMETLVIIEEPELHLHPAAHGNLAELFAKSVQEKNKRYLIETHSQNFVLRIRRLIAEGILDKDSVVIYYVDFDENLAESTLSKIKIDELGKPRNEAGEIYWPENIFSEALDETAAIRTAQLNKQQNDN